jgi:hypothetical protein
MFFITRQGFTHLYVIVFRNPTGKRRKRGKGEKNDLIPRRGISFFSPVEKKMI